MWYIRPPKIWLSYRTLCHLFKGEFEIVNDCRQVMKPTTLQPLKTKDQQHISGIAASAEKNVSLLVSQRLCHCHLSTVLCISVCLKVFLSLVMFVFFLLEASLAPV